MAHGLPKGCMRRLIMILCRVDIECNSVCKKCCKYCDIYLNKEHCEVEGVCIFAKRNMKCGNEVKE